MDSTIAGLSGGVQVASGASGARRGKSLDKALTQAFQSIDTGNTGTISKGQFESAFQSMKMPQALKSMGADALFAKMDPNGTGTVSKQDFVKGMKDLVSKTRGGRHAHRGNDGDADDASGAATSTSSTASASSTIASGLQTLETALGNSQTGGAQTNNGNAGTSGNNGVNVYV